MAMVEKKKKAKPEELAAKKIGKEFGQINTLLGRIQQFLGLPDEKVKQRFNIDRTPKKPK